MDGTLPLEVLGGDEQRSSASHQVLDGSRKHRTSLVLQPWFLSWVFFFWHKLFAIYYTLSGGRLVETPLLTKISVSSSLSTSTGATSRTKMACQDDCWEGDYEQAKDQNGCRSSSLTIATKPKRCLQKPMNLVNLFSRLSELSRRLFLLERFRQKAKINIQNPNMEVFLEFFTRQN
jgi:hypothetical protein